MSNDEAMYKNVRTACRVSSACLLAITAYYTSKCLRIPSSLFLLASHVGTAAFAAFCAFLAWALQPVPCPLSALSEFKRGVEFRMTEEGWLVCASTQGTGPLLIVFASAKMEVRLYCALCAALAEKGISTAIVQRKWGLFFLPFPTPRTVQDSVRRIGLSFDSVYAGGHSLGGRHCAISVAKDHKDLSGVALFGVENVPVGCLTDVPLPCVYIWGSRDKYLERGFKNYSSMDEWAAGRAKLSLPLAARTVCIKGGNHSYGVPIRCTFIPYGYLISDNKADVTDDEMLAQTVAAIEGMIKQGTYSK